MNATRPASARPRLRHGHGHRGRHGHRLRRVQEGVNVVSANIPESGLALLAWVLVGVLTLLGALTLAEVAVIVGKAGGNYAILRDAYGRWAGFLWGWVEFWIIRSGSIAALATIFTESLNDILRQLHPGGPDVGCAHALAADRRDGDGHRRPGRRQRPRHAARRRACRSS